MTVHQIVVITNSILPLLISISCTIIIICVIVKNKMNIRESDNGKFDYPFSYLTYKAILDDGTIANVL